MKIPDAIDVVRPSVVQITLQSGAIIGTGFFVSEDGHVVTAKHVVDAAAGADISVGVAAENIDQRQIAGGGTISIRQSFLRLGSQVVATDASDDLAVLQVQPNPFKDHLPVLVATPDEQIGWPHSVSVPDVARPRDGIDVAVSGYPLASNVLITSAGVVASAWASEADAAALTGGSHASRTEVDRYLLDLSANGRNSGGPVYRTDTSAVIGMCRSTLSANVVFGDTVGGPVLAGNRPLVYSSGLTVAVPAKAVSELLAQHGIGWGDTSVSSVTPEA